MWSLKDREAECSPPRLAEETVTGPVTMGETHTGEYDLVADGTLKMPAMFQIVTGIKYGLASTPEIMCLVKLMLPQPCEWAGFGAGRHSFTMLAQAFILGGHCRIGWRTRCTSAGANRHPTTPRSSRSPCASLRTSAARSPQQRKRASCSVSHPGRKRCRKPACKLQWGRNWELLSWSKILTVAGESGPPHPKMYPGCLPRPILGTFVGQKCRIMACFYVRLLREMEL